MLTCVALLLCCFTLLLLVSLLPVCYLLTAHNLIQHVSLRHRHPGEVAPLKAGRRLPIITRRHRSPRLLVYGFFLPIGLLTTRFNPYRPCLFLAISKSFDSVGRKAFSLGDYSLIESRILLSTLHDRKSLPGYDKDGRLGFEFFKPGLFLQSFLCAPLRIFRLFLRLLLFLIRFLPRW